MKFRRRENEKYSQRKIYINYSCLWEYYVVNCSKFDLFPRHFGTILSNSHRKKKR